jgi:hypothetical protein
MSKRKPKYCITRTSVAVVLTLIVIVFSCEEKNDGLAPYEGGRLMSDLTIEQGSFSPKTTWIGGYVSVFAVNRGSVAALDSSLIWIISAPANGLKYPVQFNQVPDGATDLTSSYGGTKVENLIEDNDYTFWVMKENAWSQISEEYGKKIFYSDDLEGTSVIISEDSIFAGPEIHTQIFNPLDVYINLDNVRSVGKLATIFVEQPTTSNNPKFSWQIKQADVTDSLIAAVGIVEGQSYNPNKQVWDVYSIDSTGGSPEYGTLNIIESPVISGEELDGTFAFVEYPLEGLERDKDYYLWIANKDWDGAGRTRVTNYYAYVTFHTW